MASEKNWVVKKSPALSKNYEDRFVVVSTETGEILDDAQGYGYKTMQKAYAGYGYKTRDKSKDNEKLEKHRVIIEFCKKHRDFVRCLEDDAFCILKGSYGPDDKFDSKWISAAFTQWGFNDLPFTAGEFLRYWNKPLSKEKKKRKRS